MQQKVDAAVPLFIQLGRMNTREFRNRFGAQRFCNNCVGPQGVDIDPTVGRAVKLQV